MPRNVDPNKKPADVGSPVFRNVFSHIINLMDAFQSLDAEQQRTVTPDDEIGYTIGEFLRTVIARRKIHRLRAIAVGFHRGLYGK